ncbi:MAG: 23S rRNA (uracil(1939)-C(5))-methyltransferase RlmD, partial [Saezia sp.]
MARPFLKDSEPRLKTPSDEWLCVESLDLSGQGVARNQAGKVVFIEGALPRERVQVEVLRSKEQWEQAKVAAIRRESALRVTPRCSYFGTCGGCAMQHFHSVGQVAIKQRALEDGLWHIGKVKPETLLRPIEGPSWGYRWRARLSVRHVKKKDTVLIGFREKSSRYVADMGSCEVLPKDMSDLLMPLRELIASMDICDQIPQLEMAIGTSVIALVLRHLEPLGHKDKQRLREFAKTYEEAAHPRKIEWWVQSKGTETVCLLDEQAISQLFYGLPEFGIKMAFKPTDFTQVNPFINQVLVSRAIRCLDVQPDERVIDWFCGLGNFTLPLSKCAKEVLGVEGSDELVVRSQENAQMNNCHNVDFKTRNLFDMSPSDVQAYGDAQKWLLDPPREGAMALCESLAQL